MSGVTFNSGISSAPGPVRVRDCIRSSTDGAAMSMMSIHYGGTSTVVGSFPILTSL